MTREEFKRRWAASVENNDLTYNDVAECAKEWGLMENPKTKPLANVLYAVLKAAGVEDAEDYNPDND